jgi:threonine/homoserine/homoserine lactone efflux protein
MGLIYIFKGIVIGFALAAPVGPLGVICIRRTLAHGSKHGLLVGISAAVADILYGIVAAFGVTLISDFIYTQQRWIRLVGGSVLILLGYHTFRSHPSTETKTNRINGNIRAFFSTFMLALTNPMTVFTFAAVFASVGLKEITDNYIFAVFLVAGIFLGTMSWFTLLTTLVHYFREKINTDGICLVNKIAGTILIILGIVAIYSSLTGF